MLELNVRASDVTASNIVFGRKITNNKKGAFLVDGFGDIHAIPIRSMSKKANQIALEKSFHRLAKKTNLGWNGKEFYPIISC